MKLVLFTSELAGGYKFFSDAEFDRLKEVGISEEDFMNLDSDEDGSYQGPFFDDGLITLSLDGNPIEDSLERLRYLYEEAKRGKAIGESPFPAPGNAWIRSEWIKRAEYSVELDEEFEIDRLKMSIEYEFLPHDTSPKILFTLIYDSRTRGEVEFEFISNFGVNSDDSGFYDKHGQSVDIDVVEEGSDGSQDNEEDDDDDEVYTLFDRGQDLEERRDYVGAESAFRQALHVAEASNENRNRDIAVILNNIARLRQANGDPQSAISLYDRAVKLLEAELGVEDTEVGKILLNFARALRAGGNEVEALKTYARASQILGNNLGVNHPDYQACKSEASSLSEGAKDIADVQDVKPSVNMVLQLEFFTSSNGASDTFLTACAGADYISQELFQEGLGVCTVGYYDKINQKFYPCLVYFDKEASGSFLPYDLQIDIAKEYDLDEIKDRIRLLFEVEFGIAETSESTELTLDSLQSAVTEINATYYGVSDDRIFLGIDGALKVDNSLSIAIANNRKSFSYALIRNVLLADGAVEIDSDGSSWQELFDRLNNVGLEVLEKKCAVAVVFD